MKRLYFVSISLLALLGSYACKEEQMESILPYTGIWKTEVYTVPVDELGSLVNQRMILTFEETSFTDTVYHVIGQLERAIVCANGVIEQIGETTLHFTYIQIGEIVGDQIGWDSLGTPGFDSLIMQYIEPVIPGEFSAEYHVTGNGLDLINTETNDTIHLSGF